jgi:hypothetical protein
MCTAHVLQHYFVLLNKESRDQGRNVHLTHWRRQDTIKKLGREAKDRPPGIILRRDRNMVPTEKTPEPWPPITNRPINCPLRNGLPGGWRAGYRSLRAGGAQRGDFFTKPEIRPRGGRTRDLEVLLGSLNHYARGPFARQDTMTWYSKNNFLQNNRSQITLVELNILV